MLYVASRLFVVITYISVNLPITCRNVHRHFSMDWLFTTSRNRITGMITRVRVESRDNKEHSSLKSFSLWVSIADYDSHCLMTQFVHQWRIHQFYWSMGHMIVKTYKFCYNSCVQVYSCVTHGCTFYNWQLTMDGPVDSKVRQFLIKFTRSSSLSEFFPSNTIVHFLTFKLHVRLGNNFYTFFYIFHPKHGFERWNKAEEWPKWIAQFNDDALKVKK